MNYLSFTFYIHFLFIANNSSREQLLIANISLSYINKNSDNTTSCFGVFDVEGFRKFFQKATRLTN